MRTRWAVASPYDGYSRAFLRGAIAAVATLDVIALSVTIAQTVPSARSHPMLPWFFGAMGGHPLRIVPVAALALAALWRFVRAPARLGAAAVALVALSVLGECHAALVGDPGRVFFASGTALFGWIVGLACARGLRSTSQEAERLADVGGAACVAAIYVGASTSKLLVGGIHWADANTLRAIVLSQRPISGFSLFGFYAHAVATHRWLAQTLATLTLLVQASAVLFPFGPRLRALAGTLVLAFHVNVWMLTPILYLQTMLIVAAFAYPWPRILSRWVPRWREEEDAPKLSTSDRVPRVFVLAFACAAVLVAAAWLAPLRRYTQLHGRPETPGGPSQSATPPPDPNLPWPDDVSRMLDGARRGDGVAGGWRFGAVTPSAEGAGVDVALEAAGGIGFVITVRERGQASFEPPRRTSVYDVFYGHERPSRDAVDPERRDAALDDVTARLQRSEASVRPPRWITDRHD